MVWQFPQALFLILPLCMGWVLLSLHARSQRRRARLAFAATSMWPRVFPEESPWRFWCKLTLRELAIMTGLLTLAGPQFGIQYEQVIAKGSDLYVLIDVSRSMLADDVKPSRLGRAKTDVASLMNRLEGERIGLIAFAGQAVVKCPLTIDYDSFRRTLNELDPDSAPRGGTAIGDAIRKAIEVFHENSGRDQAILLITDGDDQQSYPLEAAEIAAERHVAIFTVGLGDTERGSRIPQSGQNDSFLEYQGEQVWSKLDTDLLQQIALKTSGVFVPAGTRSYDLGELYIEHLQGRRSQDAEVQRKAKRSEYFQYFLLISVIALILDNRIGLYRRSRHSGEVQDESRGQRRNPIKSIVTALFLLSSQCGGLNQSAQAIEPAREVREGLRLYQKEQFEDARAKFSAAAEELDKRKSRLESTAAFDEGCAAQRGGEREKARDAYLRAGLSENLSVAVAAHFNLGTMSAERARELAGTKPEEVPTEKRQEILDELVHAVDAYRHCLDLRSDHHSARRNLELIREWMKYYTEKWRERDRQKRRDESNLLQFLEFLIESQSTLKQSVLSLTAQKSNDQFAELKRMQAELNEEIPYLREKIATDLRPKDDPSKPPSGSPTPSKEIEEGITLLQSWADTAGQKMSSATRQLTAKVPEKAILEQTAAIEQLDQIWEAVIPFQPLLAIELKEQTSIVDGLKGVSSEKSPESADVENEPLSPSSEVAEHAETASDSEPIQNLDEVFAQTLSAQSRVLKRARLLAPKAAAELDRLKSEPAEQSTSDDPADPTSEQKSSNSVDPADVKAGLEKAIELAPTAVTEMEAAEKSIDGKEFPRAKQHAEEARRILEEIQNAQPKPQNPPQDSKDQDSSKEQGNQKQPDPENQQDQNKEEQKQSGEQNKPSESKDNSKNKPEQQVSNDRLEEALRKVRERQQEKRERDRKLKGQVYGRAQVDKDW